MKRPEESNVRLYIYHIGIKEVCDFLLSIMKSNLFLYSIYDFFVMMIIIMILMMTMMVSMMMMVMMTWLMASDCRSANHELDLRSGPA